MASLLRNFYYKTSLKVFRNRRLQKLMCTCFSELSASVNSHSAINQKKNSRKEEKYFFAAYDKSQIKTCFDLSKVLLNNIIYEDEYMVAFNKPYGVTMGHFRIDWRTDPNFYADDAEPTMVGALYHLFEHYKTQDMNYITTVAWNYSGVVIAAKTTEATKRLLDVITKMKSNFRTELYQTHLAICLGIPEIRWKTERVFLEKRKEQQSANFDYETYRVFLHDKAIPKTKETRFKINFVKIQMETVMEKSYNDGSSSLIRLNSTNTKFECIEAYMASRQLCPVLGDHKYSHSVSTLAGVPVHVSSKTSMTGQQRIPLEVQQRLGIEKSRKVFRENKFSVQLVPNLFVHRSVTKLHDFPYKNDYLEIVAPVPDYFRDAIKKLELKECSYIEEDSIVGLNNEKSSYYDGKLLE